MEYAHQPVLLAEVLAGLDIQTNGVYVDGTFGRGGHAGAILDELGPEGKLLAMDKDPEAVQSAETQYGNDPRFEIAQGAFTMLGHLIAERRLQGRVNGLLLDLGVSSPQLDDPVRGFSFSDDGPLDMRMDPGTGITAAAWLAEASESAISDVLRTFGEERFARRIARRITRNRTQQPLETTRQLAEINRELEELENVLVQVPDMLAATGRLAVISFHSLEDRIVKRFIRREYRGEQPPFDLPVPNVEHRPRLRPVGKAQRPGMAETATNPRARSAVLRIAERLQ
jgi:16S rRNA (cytosine1402-N4)-methyltransferase